MNLDVQNWQPFRIDRLFDIYTGGDLIMGDIEEGKIPIASNSSENNNIAAYTEYIEGRKLFDHTKSISVADRGKFWAFIQPKDFYLATRVKGLVCKDNISLNEYQMSFVVSVLNQESFKFSYGRNCCAHLPDVEIFLPVQHNADGSPVVDISSRWSNKGFIPDWQFMEDYIKSLHHKPLTTKNKPGQVPDLKVSEWKRFLLGRLFDIQKGKRLTAEDQEDGENNYVGAIDSNNGVANHIGQEPIHSGNTISLSYNGSVGEAFYQAEPYWATDDVNALYPNFASFNESIGLFIVAVIRQEKYRFSYGRKWTLDNMRITEICLPVQHNSNGTVFVDETHKYSDEGFVPDWQFMEDYIKALPYGDRLEG